MKSDAVYLHHIHDEVHFILEHIPKDYDSFARDPVIQHAILRAFEIIGEATKNLSEPFRLAHEEIPWRRIAGMRDVLSHAYWSVNLPRVWSALRTDIPPLAQELDRIISQLDDSHS